MKITRSLQGVVIDLCRGAWIVINVRMDDDPADYDDYGPVFYSYRVVRFNLWRLAVVWEWRR